MTNFIECARLFKHHQPIPLEAMARLAIGGTNGAFRQLVVNYNGDPNNPTVGVGVTVNTTGDILGSHMLTFDEFDLSVFKETNGLLTSQWLGSEENLIPWKVVMKNQSGQVKVVRKSSYEEHGFGNLAFRMNIQPTAYNTVKICIGAVPLNMSELVADKNSGSRAYPVIRLHDLRAKIFPLEEDHHHWGSAFQPIMIVSGALADEEGNLELDEMEWPASWDVKSTAATMMQSATMPNWHFNYEKWANSVRDKSYQRREPLVRWPAPLEENNDDTEESDAGDDTDGETNANNREIFC